MQSYRSCLTAGDTSASLARVTTMSAVRRSEMRDNIEEDENNIEGKKVAAPTWPENAKGKHKLHYLHCSISLKRGE